MPNALNIVFLLSLAAALSTGAGCSSYAVRAIGVSGKIIDAQTHEPINGVSIQLTGQMPSKTSPDGSFQFLPQREYFRLAGTGSASWLPNESPYARYYPILRVEHPGYQTRIVALMELPQSRKLSDHHPEMGVGDIELTRTPE